MRLTAAQVKAIRRVVNEAVPIDTDYELRLFGSRTDDKTKGGDVDLYLEVSGAEPTELATLKRRLRVRLEEFLDLPVDLVIQDRNEPLKLVSQIAKTEGVKI